MTWISWPSLVGYPIVLGLVVSAVTAWSVLRVLRPRLDAIEYALDLLHPGHPADADDPESRVPARAAAGPELLDRDPHARYRRRATAHRRDDEWVPLLAAHGTW